MGMGMQETVGKHEREGAILVAVAESARGGAGNSATGAGDTDEGRGNGITVAPLPTPPSYDGFVESCTGSSSSGGAGNEASSSSENGMHASSSEDGSQQERRRGGGKGRADRSYHGMHSSISSLTHGSSFGASTSASSGSSGGGEGANRLSASGGSSSDVKGNEASPRRDFYVDTDGNPRLLWRGADEEVCCGSGSKRRRVHYGDRGMEALLSGAMSLSESSHSSGSGGSSPGGDSGEDGGGEKAHGSGKAHEGGSDVISDLQHHHRRRNHRRRRDLPLHNDKNSIHLGPAVTESSSNSYDGDGTSSAASRRSTPLCSGGENDGPTDHDAAIVSIRRQKTSRDEDQRVVPSAAANAAHEEKHVVAPLRDASAITMCSVTTAEPAKNAAAVDNEENVSLGPRKTETAITSPTATKKSKKKKNDAASKKMGSSLFDDDHPSDLVKPKRPMSAYNFFFRDERARIIAEGKEEQADNATLSASKAAKKAGATRKTPHRKISFEKLGKIVGQRWRDIDDASLKRYNDMAEADSARYRREMDAYYKDENAQRRARYMSGLFYKNEVGDDVAAAIARDLNMNASTTTGLALASNIRMTRQESQDGAAPTVGAATTMQQQQPASQALTSDNNSGSGSGSNNQDPANDGVVNSLSTRLGGGQQQLGAFQEHQQQLGSLPPNIAAAALQLGLTPLATLGWYTGQSTSTAASKPPNPPQSQVQQQTVPPPQTSVAQYLSLLQSIYGTNVPSTATMVATPSAQNQLASGSNQPQPTKPSSAAAAEAIRPPAGTGTSETTSQPSPQGNDNDLLLRQNKRMKVTLTAKGSPQDERGSSSNGGATTAAEVCSSLTESNASDSGEAGSNEASSGGSSGSSDNGYDTASGSSDRGPDEGGEVAGGDANVASGSGGEIGIARLHLHDFNSKARRLDDNDNGGIGNMRAVRAVKRSDSASASSDKGYDTASGSSDWRSDLSFVSFDTAHSNKGASQRQYVVEKNPRRRNQGKKKAAFKTQSSSAPPSAAPPHETDATAKRGRPDCQEGRHALIGSSMSGSDRGADRCIRMKECSGRADVRHSSPTDEYETSTSSSMSPSNNQGEKSPAVAYSDRKSPSSPESAAPEQATKGSALASGKSAKQSKTKSFEMTGDESCSKPKRPMSAYNFFFVDEREKILAENRSSSLAGRKRSNRMITFEELDKEIGQRWRDIDADTLKKYAYKAEKDTARYRREMSVYYNEKDSQRHSQFLSEIGQGADDRRDAEAGLAHRTPRVSSAIRDGHARSESSLTLSAPLTHAAVENMASNNMPSTQELVALLQQRNLLSTSAVVDGRIAGRNLSSMYSGDLALARAAAGVGLAGPSYISTGQIAQMVAPQQQSPFAPNYPEISSLLRSNCGSSNGPDTQISPNGNGLLLQTTPTAAPSQASLPLDNTLLQLYAAQYGLNPAIPQAAVAALRRNRASFSAGFQGSMSNGGA